jgi:uncharacterized protein (DUF302 family)
MTIKNVKRASGLRFPILAALFVGAAGIMFAANAEADGAKNLGYTKMLKGVTDLETAKKKVTAALKKQGFGVVTEIDVTGIVKRKLNKDTNPYVILGACNPKLSHAALEKDPYFGLLLPCNVIIFEDDKKNIVVSFAKPKEIFKLVEEQRLSVLATQVDRMIEAAFNSL